jgi:hypothetical protein
VQVSGVRRQRLDPRGPGLPASVQTKPPTAARTSAPEPSSADQGVSRIPGARRMHTRTASNNRHSAVLPEDEKGSTLSAAAPITSCAAPSRHLVAGHVRSRKFLDWTLVFDLSSLISAAAVVANHSLMQQDKAGPSA